MRHSEQLPLTPPSITHDHASDLAAVSALLDAEPRIAARVEQDLLARCAKNPSTGRAGLTGDQVLRLALARQMNGWTYEELAFHLADSTTYRSFCRVGTFERPPSKSTVAENISAITPATLAALSTLVVTGTAARAIESGAKVRIDSTVVCEAIHPPTDSSLLVDGVRVLLRLLRRAEHLAGFTAYHTHRKRAKRRLLEIQQARPQATAARRRAYRDLLTVAQATVDYATCARHHLGTPLPAPLRKLAAQFAEYVPRLQHVIAQTTQRVLDEEPVSAPEKLVSLFEPHTDVLVKDNRETYYGHKIYLTGGASGLILDCAIPKGNPADSTWTVPMLQRHRRNFGRAPRQATFDGAFASTENLAQGKALGVQDLCFAKKRGLEILAMVKSTWVYERLRAFRAGIESGISLLKRVFGLDRCIWKGDIGFHRYVRLAVLTANLLILARHQRA